MGEGEKETWNMAIATLKRFDIILKHSSYYAQNGMLLDWKRCLMDLRRNLFPFMSETDVKEAKAKLESLPKGWELYNGKINPKHFAIVNETFDELYMQFISIMKKKGLLMPKTVDPGKSILDM